MIAESTFECRIYIRKLERYSEREESPSPEILQSTFEKKDWGLPKCGGVPGAPRKTCPSVSGAVAGRDSRMSSHCLYCLWVGELAGSFCFFLSEHSLLAVNQQSAGLGGWVAHKNTCPESGCFQSGSSKRRLGEQRHRQATWTTLRLAIPLPIGLPTSSTD